MYVMIWRTYYALATRVAMIKGLAVAVQVRNKPALIAVHFTKLNFTLYACLLKRLDGATIPALDFLDIITTECMVIYGVVVANATAEKFVAIRALKKATTHVVLAAN